MLLEKVRGKEMKVMSYEAPMEQRRLFHQDPLTVNFSFMRCSPSFWPEYNFLLDHFGFIASRCYRMDFYGRIHFLPSATFGQRSAPIEPVG